MSWMLIALAVWAAVAVAVALLLGRAIQLRDHRDDLPSQLATPDFVPADWTVPITGSR